MLLSDEMKQAVKDESKVISGAICNELGFPSDNIDNVTEIVYNTMMLVLSRWAATGGPTGAALAYKRSKEQVHASIEAYLKRLSTIGDKQVLTFKA